MNTASNTNTMSYTKDEKSAVTELQRMLRYIARYNNNITPLTPDGVFGEKTEQAVKEIQEMQGLPVTGEVDLNTWNEILRVYRSLKDTNLPPMPVHIFPPEMESLKPGDKFDEVLALQIMLKKISDRVNNVPDIELTSIYDPKFQQAVIKLQEIFKIDQTGKVDKKTWNKIAQLYSHLTYND